MVEPAGAHEPHPTCQGCYTSSCQVSCDRLTAPKFKRSLCRSRRPDLLSSAGFERTAECRSQDALQGEVEEFILGSPRISTTPTLHSGRPTPSLSWHGCPCCTLKCAVITVQCQGTDQKQRSYQLSFVAHIASNQHCRSAWPQGPGLAIAWNARSAGTRNQKFLPKTKTQVDLNT